MKIYRSLADKALKSKPRSVAIGIFDGVHLGHQKILRSALSEGRKKRISVCAVTFDPHPEKILKPAGLSPKILMSLEHRLRLLKGFGIDEALVIPFNRRIARISHQNFMKKILVERLCMRSLSVGEDFRFGAKAMGDIAFLSAEAKRLGFNFVAAKHVMYQKKAISSTRIRSVIEAGDLKLATKMLGRPLSVCGTVVHGRGRGRSIGFPTANLDPHHETLPPAGVYSVFGFVGAKKYMGVVHIGERPTFGEKDPSLEVHFLKFHQDIYGREVELFFVKRLRGIQKFNSQQELKLAIQTDISKV